MPNLARNTSLPILLTSVKVNDPELACCLGEDTLLGPLGVGGGLGLGVDIVPFTL